MASKPDPLLFQGSFHAQIHRDSARHLAPPNAVYNATDYLLEKPGVAYKRGGWSRHSAAIGAVSTVAFVGTIHVPTRVVAVTDAGAAYNVTSESSPQADSIGALGFVPSAPAPVYDDKLVCVAEGHDPKIIWDDSGMTIDDLFGGSMPQARVATVHNGVVVVARTEANVRRVWFLPDPDLEPDVLVDESFVDVSNEVTGLASVSGVLLVFSPTGFERIIGGIPYGREGANMAVQPVTGGGGCLTSASIVPTSDGVVFAGEEGVWLSNGGAPLSLTSDAGIQSYWRSLFPAATIRDLAAGPLGRDFYKIDVLTSTHTFVDTLLCHLPSRRWTRLTNCATRCMAAGRTEQESFELYGAAADEGFVNKYRGMLEPAWANRADADGTTVEPTLELTLGNAGALKKFGRGRLSHYLANTAGTAWQANHAYTVGDQIAPSSVGQVFEVEVSSGDGVSLASEPDWAAHPNIGDTVAEGSFFGSTFVSWVNRGPQLVVSTAPGLRADTFTERQRFNPAGKRGSFDVLYDNQQAVTVRVEQDGPSATTEIYGVEVDAVPYEPTVTGGY